MKVEEFLSDDLMNLEDYLKKIAYYHNLAVTIPIAIEKTSYAGLFQITQQGFIDTIVESVNSRKNSLIDRVVSQYQALATL